MEGFWPIFFLLVVLKIPVLGALYIVWWAVRAEPQQEGAADDDGGGFHRWRPQPRPLGPRRGPHGAGDGALPPCPPGGRRRVLTPPAPVRAGQVHARGTVEPAPEPVRR